jgi:NAD(P)-dependent dehydrogenase (short-subunit alcohol dehydrogenase family)
MMPEALIWGASGGMGAALVRLLKAEGWQVFAAARDEWRIPPEADHTFAFDALQPQSVHSIPMQITTHSDGLDLVVYAAGAMSAATVEQMPAEAWARVIGVNLTGAYLTTQAILPLMKPDGHIMFIGAYIDHVTLPRMAAYAAAKAGLESLVKVMHKENRKLKFTLVHPGPVDTPFWKEVPFSLPKNARPPEAIAGAMLVRYHAGESGPLDM